VTAGQQFAQELTELVEQVLGGEVAFTAMLQPPMVWVTVLDRSQTLEAVPLVLCHDGEPRVALSTRFHLSWDSSEQFLRVERSSFAIAAYGKPDPIWRVDYYRDSGWKPTSYLHVHGHRDEAVFLMLAGSRQRAQRRMARGPGTTGLADLHFPMGGERFRPCLEDTLEMLICEFGVDHRDGALDAIRLSRQRWRTKQVAAAVRDHPEAAAISLRDLGYSVDPPPAGELPPRVEYLQRY